MAITLTVGATVIELPVDLRWTDEFDWNAVKQNVDTTITGAIIVEVGTLQAGRPITLAPVDESSAWISRLKLSAVKAWGDTAGLAMNLTINGVSRNVIFRHHDGGAIAATPVVHYHDIGDADFYSATFKFTEI